MKAKKRRMKAAESLLFMMHIYKGYEVGNSRGPNGCVLDAITAIAPKIAKRIRNGESYAALYNELFGEDGESLS